MIVDFHMHTSNADGGYSPDEMIERCLKNNVGYIAITDHNTYTKCTNIPNGIKVINGMEMDVKYHDYHFHLLLYNFNENSKILKNYFKRSRRHEIYLFHKHINLLKETYNLKIDKKFIRNFIRNNNYFDTVRMNWLLVEYGICNGYKEAFDKYTHIIPKHKRYIIDIEEYAKIAKDSNGIMSLAHPLVYKLDMEEIKKIIIDLKDNYHLQVVEAINNHQSKEDEKKLVNFCKNNGLLISGGSDSHYKIGEKANKEVGMVLNNKITDKDTTFLKLIKW